MFIFSQVNLVDFYSIHAYRLIFFFFFKQKTAYEMLRSLVGSEMCIRDSCLSEVATNLSTYIRMIPSATVVAVSPLASTSRPHHLVPSSPTSPPRGSVSASSPSLHRTLPPRRPTTSYGTEF
eukprot:TRINITY_DN7600_c0_g1_i2.p1 TRINITY_DN7600_c0_g1~~TRINITY_DN7600_c0_g1_i2.p1  ORF type:complete len:122 (+),score=16.43 TRINITY_DN7600_c0_g1_i2:30-395(+)